MTRFRVTIRGEGTEIRGYATPEAIAALADDASDPFVVIASPEEQSYDPFGDLNCTKGRPLQLHTAPCEVGCNYPDWRS